MGAFTTTIADGIARVELNLEDEAINKISRAVGDELEPLLSDLGVPNRSVK